jgi:flagellar protein FlaG
MNIQPTIAAGQTKTDERAVTTAATSAAKATSTTGTDAAGTNAAAEGAEPTREQVNSAVKHLNETMSASSQDLEFSVDQDSKKTIVKLVDRNTHEVLRQMPTKEALEIAKSLDKAMGKLIDQKA